MWYWITNKLHEWLLFISIIIVLGLLFFPEPTRNLAGLGVSNIKPAFDLVVYISHGVLQIAGGILDAMFS
jgi:hypothetical protein|tara:strand:+ start:280 stop:489 length:210 start_codon:yes stop_codon:yes gene_type:complete